MPDDRRLSLLLFRLLCYLFLTVLAWSVLSQLSMVLTPVAVALVLAFLLDPSVRSLEKRRLPRWLAVALMVLVLLAVLTAIGITIPMLVRQEIERFTAQLPAYQLLINTKLLPLLSKVFKYRAGNINDWIKLGTTQLTDWVRGAAGRHAGEAGGAGAREGRRAARREGPERGRGVTRVRREGRRAGRGRRGRVSGARSGWRSRGGGFGRGGARGCRRRSASR